MLLPQNVCVCLPKMLEEQKNPKEAFLRHNQRGLSPASTHLPHPQPDIHIVFTPVTDTPDRIHDAAVDGPVRHSDAQSGSRWTVYIQWIGVE